MADVQQEIRERVNGFRKKTLNDMSVSLTIYGIDREDADGIIELIRSKYAPFSVSMESTEGLYIRSE